MGKEPDDDDLEIPPLLLEAGRIFGLSTIQTRWKLLALHRRWRALSRELSDPDRGFEHQICGECGAVQPSDNKACSSCGEKLASDAARFLRALGLSVPTFLSASSLLGFAMILIYFWMMMQWKGQGILGWDRDVLVLHGAVYPSAIHEGQWWRVGTANFLHIGMWHILFNVMGLSQVGPTVEETFGRSRMVFFFALTGVIAMGMSAEMMPRITTAGASGALMGLIGVTAGWGHRRGTAHGRDVRNQMLKWAVYTMLFGIFVRANHVAHGAGFISGALLGMAFDPERIEKTKRSTPSIVMGVVGALACCFFVALTLAPPASSRDLAERMRKEAEEAAAAAAAAAEAPEPEPSVDDREERGADDDR